MTFIMFKKKKESMLHVPIFHDVFYFYQFYDLQVQQTLRTKINLLKFNDFLPIQNI